NHHNNLEHFSVLRYYRKTMAEAKKITHKQKEEKLTVSFSNSSLDIIKDLAAYTTYANYVVARLRAEAISLSYQANCVNRTYYNVPNNQLGRIIFKGLNVLYKAKDAHQDKVFIDKGNTWKIVHIKE